MSSRTRCPAKCGRDGAYLRTSLASQSPTPIRLAASVGVKQGEGMGWVVREHSMHLNSITWSEDCGRRRAIPASSPSVDWSDDRGSVFVYARGRPIEHRLLGLLPSTPLGIAGMSPMARGDRI